MKLFKSIKNPENYIRKSEESFFQNVKDMLEKNKDNLFVIEDELLKRGLSINKVLKKNSINTINLDIEFNVYGQPYYLAIILQNNVELEDMLSFCELIVKNEIIFIDNIDCKYEELINQLLVYDLEGMYIIEGGEIIEKEGATKVKQSNMKDFVKEMFIKYYNPTKTLQEKKDILKKISTEIESSKGNLPGNKGKILDRNLQKAKDSFFDIVNNIDNIRHSNTQTISLDEKEEILLMDIAVNNALVILNYNEEKEEL